MGRLERKSFAYLEALRKAGQLPLLSGETLVIKHTVSDRHEGSIRMKTYVMTIIEEKS